MIDTTVDAVAPWLAHPCSSCGNTDKQPGSACIVCCEADLFNKHGDTWGKIAGRGPLSAESKSADRGEGVGHGATHS